MASWLLILVALFGGAGLPLGIPPAKEDPTLSCVAPEECLAYLSWSGMAKPQAGSPNQTEQLLAEPEVAQAFTKIEAVVLEKAAEAVRRGDRDAKMFTEMYPAAKAILTRPAALFIAKIGDPRTGRGFQAGAIFKLDEDGPMVVGALETWQKTMLPAGAAEKTVIDRFSVYKIKTPGRSEPGPTFTWGLAGKYLVVGAGDGVFESILARARGTTVPTWLTELRRQVPVNRLSTVFYVNVKQAVAQVAPGHPLAGLEPRVKKIMDATGLSGVTSVTSITGLSGPDFVTRTLIALDGQPAGVMHILSGKPLAVTDLAPIPRDATFAVAARYDLSDVLSTALKVAGDIDQSTAERVVDGLRFIHDSTGVSVEDDLLKSLGDVWCVYNSPSEGGFLVTGVTAVAQVKNHDRLAAALDKLVTLANADFARFAAPGPRGMPPKIEKFQFAGRDVYYFNARTPEFFAAPAWCLTEKELVVSTFPQNIKAYLLRGKDFRSLSASPEVAPAFQSGQGPAVFSYVDAKQFAEVFYPILCAGTSMLLGELNRHEGISLDVSILPSATALFPHLRPGVGTLRRTAAGIEVSSRGTIPGGGGAIVGLWAAFSVVGRAEASRPTMKAMSRPKAVPIEPREEKRAFKTN